MAARQSTSERRQQIAEAALKIISTRGVHRLTAMELAKEVGIADGTIFRHFGDKAEIVDAAIAHLSALLADDFPEGIDDPIDRLQEFFVRRLRRVREHPALFRLAFTDRLEEAAGEASAARVRAMVTRSREFVRDCLEEARDRGILERSLPIPALTLMVLGTLQATALVLGNGGKKGDSDPGPDAVWGTLERVLRRPKTRRR